MPVNYRVLFSKQAAADLEEIFRYVNERSEANAPKLIGELVHAIDSLSMFPHRYRVIHPHQRTRSETRMMVVGSYLIYYRILESKQAVRIITVRHAARRRPRGL